MKNGILAFIFITLLFDTWTCGQETLTKNQRLIAKTLLGEARGEGKVGMEWVAAVIAQRVHGWGKTPSQVCIPVQFSCWNKNDPNRAKLDTLLRTHPMRHHAIKLAKSIDTIDRKNFKNVDHYHNKNSKPYWVKGKKPLAKVGKHYFYKLRP